MLYVRSYFLPLCYIINAQYNLNDLGRGEKSFYFDFVSPFFFLVKTQKLHLLSQIQEWLFLKQYLLREV